MVYLALRQKFPANGDDMKKRNRWIPVAIMAALALAWLHGGGARHDRPSPAAPPPAARGDVHSRRTAATDHAGPRQTGPYTFGNLAIVDIGTGAILPIDSVDLKPTLDRIAAGRRDRHRNDGAVFHNRSGSLPKRPGGYYREYVVRTPGVSGPGPQRLVVGEQGEIYYTPDHYETFHRLEQWE